MFRSSEYRRIARDKLRGNWSMAVIVTLIASLLGGLGNSGLGNAVSANLNVAKETLGSEAMGKFLSSPAVVAALVIAAVVSIAVLIVGPAIMLGYLRFNLDLVEGNRADEPGVLFSYFRIFGKALELSLLTGLFTVLWMLLFIVPGIIAAYSYSMAMYIMADDPSVGIMEAIRRSREMMRGHRWRLFCLGFSFIGWSLLSVLTLGIGTLWLNPYMQAAQTAFYLDRAGRRIPLPAWEQRA